jgi:hypothetical protein
MKEGTVETGINYLPDGFYYLYSPGEESPTLVQLYTCRNGGHRGFGFNTYDGGGFLPVDDVTSTTKIVPVLITGGAETAITSDELADQVDSVVSAQPSNKYDAVKAKFKEGDWVFGVGEHVGCSPVFDHDTDQPQPFSYLDATNPDDFRLATADEIEAAKATYQETTYGQ